MFARVVYGIRLSLFIGFVVTMLETLHRRQRSARSPAGVGAGSTRVIMRVIDILLGIPYLVLAFAFIAVIGRGVGAVILTLAITVVAAPPPASCAPASCRPSSSSTSRRRAPSACRGSRIMCRHILPNVIQPIIVLVAVGIGSAMLAEAALSFLGVGVQEPTPSLGPDDRPSPAASSPPRRTCCSSPASPSS